jgi:hypothetical protein
MFCSLFSPHIQCHEIKRQQQKSSRRIPSDFYFFRSKLKNRLRKLRRKIKIHGHRREEKRPEKENITFSRENLGENRFFTSMIIMRLRVRKGFVGFFQFILEIIQFKDRGRNLPRNLAFLRREKGFYGLFDVSDLDFLCGLNYFLCKKVFDKF